MSLHSIREVRVDDEEWIFRACQDPQIQYWTTVPRPYLMEHARVFVRGEVPEYKIWVIEEEGAKPVGVISIHEVDESGSAEIGYWVAPWGRGKGAAKRAIELVASYGRDNPRIRALAARISDENVVSQKVAVAAGLLRAESSNQPCHAGAQETSATIYRICL